MSASPGIIEVVAGGFGALLGPALAVPAVTLLLAGSVFARVRDRAGHLATFVVFVLLFSAATTSRGLAAGTGTGWIVGLAILLVLCWLVARHEEPGVPWVGLASGVLLATLVIVWRPEVYGPLLGALRGGWQAAPDQGLLFLYHAATGIGLGGLYLLGTEFGRGVPRRLAIGLWWSFSVGAGALSSTGLWRELMQVLLLRWPYLNVG